MFGNNIAKGDIFTTRTRRAVIFSVPPLETTERITG